MTMNFEEQFDLDMLQAIRTVARHASGRPDKQDPDVVLARARETIHVQRRRINEVENLHDRRLREQQAAEKQVEELQKNVKELRALLDGHLVQMTAMAQKAERLEVEKKDLEAKLAHATSPVPDVVEGSFPYTIVDVDLIEKHRGHAYPRLRSTVQALVIVNKSNTAAQKRIAAAREVTLSPERKWASVTAALDEESDEEG